MTESSKKRELEQKIQQYTEGELSSEEVDALWAELIQEEESMEYLKTVANVKAIAEREQKNKKHRQPKKRYTYWAAAAAILLLITVGSLMSYMYNSSPGVDPIAHVELDYYRSAENPAAGEGTQVISRAITLANTGNIQEALALLHSELENASQPQWVAQIHLNLGSLYYNQSQYQEAINHYNEVIALRKQIDILMLEKAYWYIGNAYFQTDQLDKARANIKEAYDLNGAYRRVTESYLNALS